MMKKHLAVTAIFFCTVATAQKTYADSMRKFLADYVVKHEVVKGADKKYLQFYPANAAYRVLASFTPATEATWLSFKTSGVKEKLYRIYGTVSFTLNGQPCQLNVYQSQDLMGSVQYKTYLFLPFTDATTGKETYGSGRYLDLSTTGIQNNKMLLDFNKAYNPYCAYVNGVYNCPVPPKENALTVAVRAGEKAYAKSH